MVTGGRALGVMSFVFSDSERVYTEQDLAFAQELAARAATAIENARLYTERAEVARTLQASLLPEELPQVAGLALRRGVPRRPGGRRRGRRLLRRLRGRGRADGAAGGRDRHGRDRRGADLARAAHGQDLRGVRPAPGRGAGPRQPCAPPAPADRAGDDDLRPDQRGRDHARGRRPPAPAAQAPDGAVRAGRRARACCSAPSTPTPRATSRRSSWRPATRCCCSPTGSRTRRGRTSRFGDDRLRAAVDAAPGEPRALLRAVSAELDAFAHGTRRDDRAMLALQRT